MDLPRLVLRTTHAIAAAGPRGTWRLYVLLVIANELDLVFTYVGLNTGTFVEANPLMAPLLFTAWPMAMKFFPLAGLALALSAAVEGEPPRRRAHGAVSAAAGVYAVVLILHVLNVLLTSLPGGRGP
jgi:hypothetical protein